MIEAVLWDNDGVLLDTEALFFETTHRAFAEVGLSLTAELWGRYYLGEGKTSREIAALLGGNHDRIVPTLEERNKRYRQALQQQPPLRPRIRETLMWWVIEFACPGIDNGVRRNAENQNRC